MLVPDLIFILIKRCVIYGLSVVKFWCYCIIELNYFRTKEIFDIIIDFPDSMGALHDLRVRL